MVEWLAVWGISTATASIFRPILENLAKQVAEGVAKSYVQKCFSSVYSAFHQKPLAKATGLAVKKLLDLIEDELLDADLSRDEVAERIDDIQRFIDREEVATAIGSLFLDPDYHLDPATFASAWQNASAAKPPADFSWERIAKRFAREVREIRTSSSELQRTFQSLANEQNSVALKELQGLPPEFDLETYREALLERYGNLDFASLDMTGAYYSDVQLWSVFVPQSVRECHEYDPQLLEIPKEHLKRLAEAGELNAEQLQESEKLQEERRQAYVKQPMRPVLEVVGRTEEEISTVLVRTIPRTVILGDPGSGKSSLLRFLALRWARLDDANLRYTQPLPLLIELREYNRWECSSGKGFLKYLHEAPISHRLNQHALNHLLDKPDRVVLLLDGLDEVFDPAERELVVNDIHRFSNEHKQVRIVLTSRVVGYKPQRLRDADFRHFMLQDLDQEQINGFLDNWHDITFDKPEEAEPKRKRLAQAIENSKSIAQLAGNPLLLTMMAILNRNQKLPDDRVDLYQQCSRLLLHQWDVERTLGEFPGQSTEIGLREKTDILRSVAYAMQTRLSDNSRANYIDGVTLTSLIEDYLHTELRIDQAKAISRSLVKQLRERNFILCYLGADSYAFVHRTFLEYFCAAEIVHQFNVAKTLNEEGLIAFFDTHCRDDDWREVLRLICGQIDEKFVGRIVQYLATRTEWQGEPIPEVPLAIYCMTEVRTVSRLDPVGTLLADVIVKIVTNAGHADMYEALKPAVRELNTSWPGIDKSARFWRTHTTSVANNTRQNMAASYFWPVFAAHVTDNRGLICEFAESKHTGVRIGALQGLVEKWPDENTRELLQQRAIQDVGELPRDAALQALAENWPDEKTRELLERRAVEDVGEFPRHAALQGLAENWPDEKTRRLLEQRAVEDDDEFLRSAALLALAKKWPDENTRELLQQRAIQDVGELPRHASLQALAEKWPDENTRELLQQRAVEDVGEYSRRGALLALAAKWPDETTRELFQQWAVQDDKYDLRGAALQALAEKWPDEKTRELLEQRAEQDDHYNPRHAALEALAENWPNEKTRGLLQQRAVQDDHYNPRHAAVQALAEKWPDETTRELLEQRAVEDDHYDPRRAALDALAKKWPDETTRELLEQRAVEDDHYDPRRAALDALTKKWPDEKTRELLRQRTNDSSLPQEHRHEHCVALSRIHSEFGRIVFTRDLDGYAPYLDARHPVPREHVEKAAETCGIPPEKIDAEVTSLSEWLGWEITQDAPLQAGIAR